MTLESKAREMADRIPLPPMDMAESELVRWAVADAMIKLAKEFAEKALRVLYEVDDNDQTSSDGERARGGYRVRYAYAGTGCVERRHYRADFNAMIAAAIKAAEEQS